MSTKATIEQVGKDGDRLLVTFAVDRDCRCGERVSLSRLPTCVSSAIMQAALTMETNR